MKAAIDAGSDCGKASDRRMRAVALVRFAVWVTSRYFEQGEVVERCVNWVRMRAGELGAAHAVERWVGGRL